MSSQRDNISQAKPPPSDRSFGYALHFNAAGASMSDGRQAGIGEDRMSRTIDLDQSPVGERRAGPKRTGSDTMTVMPANSVETPSASKYDRLIAAAQAVPPAATILVHPCDETSLRGRVNRAAAGRTRQ